VKYSVIMPYHNRAAQLKNTLHAFRDWYSGRNDYEVIVVEDPKNLLDRALHSELVSILTEYPWTRLVSFESAPFYNPSPLYNKGAEASAGRYLLLTNPECRHVSDVFGGLDEEFDQGDNCYVICACRAMDQRRNFWRWYQHSVHRNACYHFCSAISRFNYWRAGGFDERFRDGYGYEDNAFRDRVRKLGVPFITRDDLIVEHQWHVKVRPPNYREALRKNRILYEEEYGKAE